MAVFSGTQDTTVFAAGQRPRGLGRGGEGYQRFGPRRRLHYVLRPRHPGRRATGQRFGHVPSQQDPRRLPLGLNPRLAAWF